MVRTSNCNLVWKSSEAIINYISELLIDSDDFYWTSKLLVPANLTLPLAIMQVQDGGQRSMVFWVNLRKEKTVLGCPSLCLAPSPSCTFPYHASLASSLSWTTHSVLLTSCHASAQCSSNNQDIRRPKVKEASELAREIFEESKSHTVVFFWLGSSGAMHGHVAPPRWSLITLWGGSSSQPSPVVPSTWRWLSIERPCNLRPSKLLLLTFSRLTADGVIPCAFSQFGESSSGPRIESWMVIEVMEVLEGQGATGCQPEETSSRWQQVSVSSWHLQPRHSSSSLRPSPRSKTTRASLMPSTEPLPSPAKSCSRYENSPGRFDLCFFYVLIYDFGASKR